jgi:hypothetical protein
MHSRVVGFIQRRLKHVRGHGATAGALCLARQGCQPSQLALRPPFLLRRFRLIAAEDLEPPRRRQLATGVAQAWRGGGPRQALLAGLLRGTREVAIGRRTSRLTGDLCRATKTADVVDAHVALLAQDGDVVLTSDVDDLRPLLRTRGISAQVLRC